MKSILPIPTMDQLLKETVEKKASDLHIGAGYPPTWRINGDLRRSPYAALTPPQVKELVCTLLPRERVAEFEKEKELDFSFGIEGLARFRVNFFYQRGALGVAIRALPFSFMTFEECGLPVAVIEDLAQRPSGLVLVTGATGSGKSTTLASIINYINNIRSCHIVTIEDPIEFIYQNKKSVVDQREIGSDTGSFSAALKHVLRQDPDVILIGEMRDLETVEAALTIAETGHLVFATLHTSDSVQTINRIVDVFPAHQQQQVRVQFSFVLLGIISQQLLPMQDMSGRVLATEILIANSAVRSLIRESKAHQIYSVIQTGKREGMRSLNQSLVQLVKQGLISTEMALSRTPDPSEFHQLIIK